MNLPVPDFSTQPRQSESTATALHSSTGATAALDGDAIVVRSPQGEELVRYAPAVGLTVCAPDGDLRLAAPRGRVLIQAAAGLAVETEGAIGMQAASWRLQVDEATIVATRIEAQAREWVQSVGRLEVRARRLVESFQDAYREVDGLMQTRAGRVRQLVRGACQLFAERTTIASEADTSIDGEHVYLG